MSIAPRNQATVAAGVGLLTLGFDGEYFDHRGSSRKGNRPAKDAGQRCCRGPTWHTGVSDDYPLRAGLAVH
jgi:hypothetical protein